jgi:phytoene synthase
MSDVEHVLSFLRENDRDRYLAALIVPADKRAAVAALHAFNTDVAMIRERVQTPAPGEIRLQWWNDALSGDGHGAVRQNPLAAGLLDTIEPYRLPIGTFQRLLGARRFDLYDDAMPDVESFEGYAGETNGSVLQLAGMVLNGGEQLENGDAAGHLGVAQAYIGHVRAFGFYAARGRIMLPWSVLAANGVNEGEIFAGTASEGLVESLGQFLDMARDHLDKSDAAISQLPASVRPAFAITAILRVQLDRVAQRADPFLVSADLADWQKIASLVWWRWRNR